MRSEFHGELEKLEIDSAFFLKLVFIQIKFESALGIYEHKWYHIRRPLQILGDCNKHVVYVKPAPSRVSDIGIGLALNNL